MALNDMMKGASMLRIMSALLSAHYFSTIAVALLSKDRKGCTTAGCSETLLHTNNLRFSCVGA